jgi:hypothetical protein
MVRSLLLAAFLAMDAGSGVDRYRATTRALHALRQWRTLGAPPASPPLRAAHL